MKYLLLVFVLGFISSVYNHGCSTTSSKGYDVTTVSTSPPGQELGVSSIQCRECKDCSEDDTNARSVSCVGSCVKSIKDNIITKGCSNISLISKCERQGDLTVCACDSNDCNISSETRISLFGLFTSCVIFLLETVIN